MLIVLPSWTVRRRSHETSELPDRELLAGLARGWLPALRQALVGNFKPHHAPIFSLTSWRTLTTWARRSRAHRGGRAALVPFADKAENLATVTGVAERVSQVILAELGPGPT